MKARLLIVNNGLKDLRGHYFETSVAIAEAARKLGYKPALAAHVSCPRAIVPEWLDFYPLCTTDHWMAHPPTPTPDLRGLRGDAVALAGVSAESVRRGEHTVADYLRARFEPLDFAAAAPAAAQPVPPLPRIERLKQQARRWAPPAVLPGLRWAYQRRGWPFATARDAARHVLPPALYDQLRRAKRRLQGGTLAPSPVPAPPTPEPHGDPLRRDLEQVGQAAELDHLLAFRRDLERLLCLAGAGADDHVFLPTAHGRELLAVRRLLADLEPSVSPTFHLEFRHALDMPAGPDRPDVPHPYVVAHRVFFEHCRRQPLPARVHLYTDTEELAEEYEHCSGLPFGVLPIPFRSRLLKPHAHRGGRPLCLAFLGDVREEKGLHWLPDLIDALTPDYVAAGRVRFLVQATLAQPDWNPLSRAALERLRQYPPEYVRLAGADAALTPEEYYELVSEADVLLCPYSPRAYRRRSSGTLTEGLAAGVPTVVPRGTWLARQQPAGAGETFHDLSSFVEAVRRVVDHYARYQMCARAYQDRHSPRALVEQLVGTADERLN